MEILVLNGTPLTNEQQMTENFSPYQLILELNAFLLGTYQN
jgi:hypothetical protein